MKHMLRFLAVLLMFASSAFSEILSSNRVSYWSPGSTVGVIGGIPTWTNIFCDISASIPGTNIVADKTGVTNVSDAVWAALALCPSNQIIYFPAGTYRFTSRMEVKNEFGKPWINNRILKGDSARSTNTTFLFDITNASHHALNFGSSRIADAGQFQNGTVAKFLTNNLPTDSFSLTLSNVPPDIFDGAILWLDELNDGTFVTAYGSGTATNVAATAYDRPRNGTRNRASYHTVTNVTGTTVSFTPPVPLGFTTNNSAIAIGSMNTRSSAAYGCKIGLENIHFTQSSTANMGSFLRYNSVSDCWVKDCRFSLAKTRAIQPANVTTFELVGNDFIKAGAYTVNAGYVLEGTHMGGCLIENNAVDEWHVSFLLENSSYNVVAYNACFWSHPSTANVQISDTSTHAAFSTKNLWEGNIVNRVQIDFYYGSTALNTIARNHLRGTDTNTTQNRFALMLDTKSLSNNVVGNIMGDPSLFWFTSLTNYDFSNTSNMIMRLGYPEIGNNRYPANGGTNSGTLDLNVTNTAIFHGNTIRNESSAWETVWNAGIVDQTIPSSYFRGSKPSYFGNWPWPSHGPDIGSLTNNIPASARLLGLSDSPSAPAMPGAIPDTTPINRIPILNVDQTPNRLKIIKPQRFIVPSSS